tara:strand:+ start:302 stop:832 length:531 start_codon:yes stop_codon:yes gene_type:complete
MKLGNFNIFIFAIIFFCFQNLPLNSADKIESVPLINLDDLSPTFEEDKDELEKTDENVSNLDQKSNTIKKLKTKKKHKIYINLKALDKITAKTSAFRMKVGEKKFFGPLEIKALKCQSLESSDLNDVVAYLQVKDLSIKDNNQVFLFNGWTFASSPTLQSLDHPVYDLWITSCENI